MPVMDMWRRVSGLAAHRWVYNAKYFSTKLRGVTTVQWFAPTTLTALTALQAQYARADPGTVKYVCGNTAYGVQKYFNASGYQTPYTVRAARRWRCRPLLLDAVLAPSGLCAGTPRFGLSAVVMCRVRVVVARVEPVCAS